MEKQEYSIKKIEKNEEQFFCSLTVQKLTSLVLFYLFLVVMFIHLCVANSVRDKHSFS